AGGIRADQVLAPLRSSRAVTHDARAQVDQGAYRRKMSVDGAARRGPTPRGGLSQSAAAERGRRWLQSTDGVDLRCRMAREGDAVRRPEDRAATVTGRRCAPPRRRVREAVERVPGSSVSRRAPAPFRGRAALPDADRW